MQNNVKFIILFSLVFLMHLGIIFGLQIYNPFASITNDSPDYREYEGQAETIAQRARLGKFSLYGLVNDLPKDMGSDMPDHYYPVIIGYLCALFGGSPMITGQIFNAFIAGFCAIILFLIMRKIGASQKISFVLSFLASLYPTYLLISSLFHEDALTIFLVLSCLLAGIKALESFTLKNVAVWYALIIVSSLMRSFMGIILGISFLVSYIFLHAGPKEEKIKNSVKIAVLVFFASFIAEAIYRFTGLMAHGHSVEWIFQLGYIKDPLYHYHPDLWNFEGWFSGGWYSGVLSLPYSSLVTLLGPFPWNINSTKNFLYLLEIIPWIVILPLIFKGIGQVWQKNRLALYTAVFATIQLLFIALYVETRSPEIIMRLRIPAFLVLLPFAAAAIHETNFLKSLQIEWKKLIKYVF